MTPSWPDPYCYVYKDDDVAQLLLRLQSSHRDILRYIDEHPSTTAPASYVKYVIHQADKIAAYLAEKAITRSLRSHSIQAPRSDISIPNNAGQMNSRPECSAPDGTAVSDEMEFEEEVQLVPNEPPQTSWSIGNSEENVDIEYDEELEDEQEDSIEVIDLEALSPGSDVEEIDQVNSVSSANVPTSVPEDLIACDDTEYLLRADNCEPKYWIQVRWSCSYSPYKTFKKAGGRFYRQLEDAKLSLMHNSNELISSIPILCLGVHVMLGDLFIFTTSATAKERLYYNSQSWLSLLERGNLAQIVPPPTRPLQLRFCSFFDAKNKIAQSTGPLRAELPPPLTLTWNCRYPPFKTWTIQRIPNVDITRLIEIAWSESGVPELANIRLREIGLKKSGDINLFLHVKEDRACLIELMQSWIPCLPNGRAAHLLGFHGPIPEPIPKGGWVADDWYAKTEDWRIPLNPSSGWCVNADGNVVSGAPQFPYLMDYMPECEFLRKGTPKQRKNKARAKRRRYRAGKQSLKTKSAASMPQKLKLRRMRWDL
ncbi:hypothetical protein N7462_004908 [Penicillium macrosclerotiorum]|uniref:uncharacterized protein n=1 Tax=Penicillium macrosclerotiorum TaxID=303699 RepID=UPI00254899FC|nr:uncharacterized protein N7462_004908 [Penicillium macrosclerotiorum]KAJ5690516.1 hypothetical protein N7462_004908 [Penicillium macrosclerotiorum]